MKRLFYLFLMLIVMPVWAEQKQALPPDNPSSVNKLTPINLQLLWKHQFEFAGFYAAIAQGYYRDAGLDVRLKEYQFGIDVAEEVGSGRAQYGVGDSSLIVSRDRGKPVVLLSNIFQHSPMVLISKSESGIISPAQMAGKKVMLARHELSNASIIAMLAEESIELDQVTVVDHSFNVEDLIEGKVDVMSAFATNEPIVLKQKGIRVNIIDPLNYGIDFYGNNIFTSESEIKLHPKRVENFLAASLKGWVYALENQDEVIDLIVEKYSQQKTRADLKLEAEALGKFILPKAIKIGTIDKLRMSRIVDVHRQLGMLGDAFSLDSFIYQSDMSEKPEMTIFTAAEQKWIQQNPDIILGVDPDWAPFEFIDENNHYSGMVADFIRLTVKKAGLKIKIQPNKNWIGVINSAKKGEIDVLPGVMKSPQRAEYLRFTSPHFSYPMVILTRNDRRFISNLDDLKDERIVVVDGYVSEDFLRNKHPGLSFSVVENVDKAITKVTNGDVFAFVGNLPSISHAIEKRGDSNLRISGTTPYMFALSIAVPKGKNTLFNILQKARNEISDAEMNEIKKRWIAVGVRKSIDYGFLIKLVMFAVLMLIIILIWNRRLAREIKNRIKAEQIALQSENRFRMLFEDNRAVELIINPESGQIIDANRAAATFYGYSRMALRDLSIAKINTLSEAEIQQEMENARNECRAHFFFKHRLASGDIRDVEVHSGPVQWDDQEVLYSIIHDVTAEKKLQKEIARNTEKLSYQASHDTLTGLINRREFELRLAQTISSCVKDVHFCNSVLLYMDLDQFKVVNDTAGHAAGDELLRKVSGIIQSKVRNRDTLARLGGDEFALLLQNCSTDDAIGVALSIIKSVKKFHFLWEKSSFRIGVSIGLSVLRQNNANSDEFLGQADAACYGAKQQGRNCYQVFSDDNEDLARRKGEMWWVNEITRAMDDDRLLLYQQPIVPVANSSGHEDELHYEVLLRMVDEHNELILPGKFLPAAERYKMMPAIDKWVVKTLFTWLTNNPEHLKKLYKCTINLSGHSIGDKSFQQFIIEEFENTGIAPNKICWELTESTAISHYKESQQFIGLVRTMGCSVSLDDFGSGLSSFSNLKYIGADFLKIDGSFVKDMLHDPKDLLIIESIHRVGKGMRMATVAEFVENELILEKLKKIGIEYAQGYAIARPAPLTDLS